MHGTNSKASTTYAMQASLRRGIRHTRTGQQTSPTTATSLTLRDTECAGSHTLSARAGTPSWTEHGRSIPVGDSDGFRHIPGDGCPITTAPGSSFPGMDGHGGPGELGLAGTRLREC